MNGNRNLLVSVMLGILTWFTPDRVELLIKVLLFIGTSTATVFACINYYYSIKKNKLEIKKNSQS